MNHLVGYSVFQLYVPHLSSLVVEFAHTLYFEWAQHIEQYLFLNFFATVPISRQISIAQVQLLVLQSIWWNRDLNKSVPILHEVNGH